jgi:hypothetical protein
MRPRLTGVSLKGFKTVLDMPVLGIGDLTVLIGANGAGKSNLLSFFGLLNAALTTGSFQSYVARQGGGSALLHRGELVSERMVATLWLENEQRVSEYWFELSLAAKDQLIFEFESAKIGPSPDTDAVYGFGGGRTESDVLRLGTAGTEPARTVLSALGRIAAYHFHDTSRTSRIRLKWKATDNRQLKEDAGNLGAFLLRLRTCEPSHYSSIVSTVRLILPFFADFELYSESGFVLLRWRETGSDHIFDASQASDGMLRIFALVALLQQPQAGLPDLLVLDEPELGLHPYAVEVIGALIRKVSKHVQVIAATQSVSLLDQFEPGEIVVVDRSGPRSEYRRLDIASLAGWLESYSVSELWEKNVLGGRPSR